MCKIHHSSTATVSEELGFIDVGTITILNNIFFKTVDEDTDGRNITKNHLKGFIPFFSINKIII